MAIPPKCHYCKKPRAGVTIDHIVPKALGGTNHAWNKIKACQPCNGAKADKWPTCACDWCERARRKFKELKRLQKKIAAAKRAEGIEESGTLVP